MTSDKPPWDEILRWVRAIAFDKIVPKLEELGEEEKKVYELSTYDNGVRNISEAVGYGKDKISSLKKEWYRKGLMRSVTVKGGNERYIRLDSLENFGITVPDIESEEEDE